MIRGSADLFTDRGTVSIGAGARALARQGDAPSQPMSFNSARWDAFDRWSQERLSQRRGAARLGTCRRRSVRTARCSTPTAAGTTSRPTAMSGSRTSSAAGVRTITAAGASMRVSGGHGWAAMPGPGRRIITDAGGRRRRARGSGCRARRGARPGCTGRCRPATSAGARSGSTAGPWCPSATATRRARALPTRPVGGMDGRAAQSLRRPWSGDRVWRLMDGASGPKACDPSSCRPRRPGRPYAVARANSGVAVRGVRWLVGVPRVGGRRAVAWRCLEAGSSPGQTAASREWGRDMRVEHAAGQIGPRRCDGVRRCDAACSRRRWRLRRGAENEDALARESVTRGTRRLRPCPRSNAARCGNIARDSTAHEAPRVRGARIPCRCTAGGSCRGPSQREASGAYAGPTDSSRRYESSGSPGCRLRVVRRPARGATRLVALARCRARRSAAGERAEHVWIATGAAAVRCPASVRLAGSGWSPLPRGTRSLGGPPPAAAPRQAPDRGSIGVAAPRGGGEYRGGARGGGGPAARVPPAPGAQRLPPVRPAPFLRS